jgi:predicted P-loop ATPase
MDAGFGSSISKLMEDLIQSRRVSIDYNPFKDYFDSLEWDGKDHLSRLANTITILNEGDQTQLEDGKQPADYWVEMFTSWMAHSIACTLSEGYFINDVVLVLQSKQGKFKTTWLNRLCPKALHPDYIYTGHIVPALTDKVTAGHLVTRFILNLDDQLESIHNKDFNAIKSIISTKDVPLRKAFAKDDYDRKRICNFVASVNNARILQDNENRRYMCFKIDSIDLSVDVNIDQCWAQAKHIYQSKDNWYWSSEERDIIRKLNELFTSINPEEEFLQQLFTPALPNTTGVKYYSVSEIIRVINKYAGHPIVKNNGHGLKSRLTKMGFSDPIMKRLAGAKYGTYVIPVLEKFYISEKDGHIFFPDSSNTNSQLNADANHSVIEREIEETTPF